MLQSFSLTSLPAHLPLKTNLLEINPVMPLLQTFQWLILALRRNVHTKHLAYLRPTSAQSQIILKLPFLPALPSHKILWPHFPTGCFHWSSPFSRQFFCLECPSLGHLLKSRPYCTASLMPPFKLLMFSWYHLIWACSAH